MTPRRWRLVFGPANGMWRDVDRWNSIALAMGELVRRRVPAVQFELPNGQLVTVRRKEPRV